VRPEGAERVVLALARDQHGILAWRQIERAGLSAGWVEHRVGIGWLQRMYRGVYLVGPLQAPHSRAMAATLTAGPGALLSHHPGVVLWGFRPPPVHTMHVTVPGRKVRDREGIRMHRSRLHPADATRLHGIPVTSAERTLLDYAATATANELDRAINEAQVQRRVSVHSLNEQFSRYPTHRGTTALKKAIRTDPKLTRSEAEWRLLQLIRKARLPEPETNVRICSWEVDLLWRAERVVVEIDGYAFHSSRSSFERDRRKDAELTARGWRVIRITWRQLTREPEATVALLASAIAVAA
jgi:very-short-patch-repair endonuclease